MKTGIIAFAIAVVLLMVTVQTVAATAFTAVGNVEFEDGTIVPYGWTVEIWNLDQIYSAEPWTDVTKWVPPVDAPYEYGMSCEYILEDDRIHVRVTSTDGTYVGENISRWGDVYIGPSAKTCMDVTVYEVLPETETFTKSLPLGWNLISLPLTPTDNSTSAVLTGVSQDAVKSYNAATHQFEDATAMDPGTGYFVHVTTAGTWSYDGTAYTSMTSGLSTGLNMVGWTNTSANLPDALSSITDSYRYVAHWDASSQSYEVYEPNAPADFNDFTTMERGEGYFIAATSSCTLAYP